MNIFQLILIVAFGFIVAEIAKRKDYIRQSGEPKEKSKQETDIFCLVGLWRFIIYCFYHICFGSSGSKLRKLNMTNYDIILVDNPIRLANTPLYNRRICVIMNNKKFSLILILALSTILTSCGKLPSVAGKDLQTVQDELDDMKRDYSYSVNTEYNDSIERGLVPRIVPESGTKAPKGSSIQIFVSKGAPITISDFYNSDAETAKTSLTSQGLAFTVNEKYTS